MISSCSSAPHDWEELSLHWEAPGGVPGAGGGGRGKSPSNKKWSCLLYEVSIIGINDQIACWKNKVMNMNNWIITSNHSILVQW